MDNNYFTWGEAQAIIETICIIKNLRSYIIDNHYTLSSFCKKLNFDEDEIATFWSWLKTFRTGRTITLTEITEYLPTVGRILFALNRTFGITWNDMLSYEQKPIVHKSTLIPFIKSTLIPFIKFILLIIFIIAILLVDFRILVLIFIINFFCGDD